MSTKKADISEPALRLNDDIEAATPTPAVVPTLHIGVQNSKQMSTVVQHLSQKIQTLAPGTTMTTKGTTVVVTGSPAALDAVRSYASRIEGVLIELS